MIIFNRQCCSLSFQRECAFPIVTFYFLFRVWIISCRLTAPCVFSHACLCKHSYRIAHFIKWILWCQGVLSKLNVVTKCGGLLPLQIRHFRRTVFSVRNPNQKQILIIKENIFELNELITVIITYYK